MALKFKLKDKVKVIAGKDKGREGDIEKILPKEKKAIVSGINVYKRHVKGGGEQKAGIYEVPRPIDLSKLMLICPKCHKETRVGFKIVDGKKYRFCKECKIQID
ncbi:MAG: LSU ribosomal protein L24p (L26e) [Candidatus Woesebacteria bacterium]|nr:MAG: LSU ribosomal protein L24p (L26e) [Candidatus Woesebacteria bacterium]